LALLDFFNGRSVGESVVFVSEFASFTLRPKSFVC